MPTQTIDDFIEERNNIVFDAEGCGVGAECWIRLGVANRHIGRVLDGVFQLTPGIEKEMQRCMQDTRHWLRSKQPTKGACHERTE